MFGRWKIKVLLIIESWPDVWADDDDTDGFNWKCRVQCKFRLILMLSATTDISVLMRKHFSASLRVIYLIRCWFCCIAMGLLKKFKNDIFTRVNYTKKCGAGDRYEFLCALDHKYKSQSIICTYRLVYLLDTLLSICCLCNSQLENNFHQYSSSGAQYINTPCYVPFK